MSKELEALRNFISECENDWKTQPKRWVDGAINSNVSKYMDSLKSILTPPTAEEVCMALSDYFGFSFYYQDNFFYRSDGIKHIYPLKVSGFTEIQLYDGTFTSTLNYT